MHPQFDIQLGVMMQVSWTVLMSLRGVGLTEKQWYQELAPDMELSAV